MDWALLGLTLLRAAAAYAVLIAYIRLSGNRTLAKMRAFDFVVTIALGSLLATTIVARSTPLWQGLAAMGALIGLQWIVARLSTASGTVNRLVTNEAIRLYHEGEHDEAAMKRARVTKEEIQSAARAAGHQDLDDIQAIWLEVNGSISVVRKR